MCYRVREPVGVVSWMCVVYDATLGSVDLVLVFFD